LAGFYLIPSLGLLSLIRPAGWINAGHVGWQNTFVLQVVGHPWSKVFYIFGIWCYLLAIVVAVNLWSHRKSNRERDRIALDWFLVGAAGLFFACQLSYPLWCLDTPLQMLQRPFRFLPIATISMLISAAYCLTPISRAGRTTRTAIAGLILLAAATYAVFQFHIHYHKPDEQVAPEALQGEFGVAEYIPAVAGPHWETYVQSGGFAGQCRRLGLRCSSSLNGGAFHWTVEGAKPVTVLLPLFAYPAWHVTVNPRSAVYVDAETGLFAANLPAGLSNVEARWVLLPAERRGVYISLATGLILIFIMVLRGSCSRASPKCRSAVESGK